MYRSEYTGGTVQVRHVKLVCALSRLKWKDVTSSTFVYLMLEHCCCVQVLYSLSCGLLLY